MTMIWMTFLLGCFCGATAVAALYEYLREQRAARCSRPVPTKPVHPCELMHRAGVIEVQDVTNATGQPFTLVLKYCPNCLSHFVLGYPGKWTLEQLVKTEHDIAVLEKMVK